MLVSTHNSYAVTWRHYSGYFSSSSSCIASRVVCDVPGDRIRPQSRFWRSIGEVPFASESDSIELPGDYWSWSPLVLTSPFPPLPLPTMGESRSGQSLQLFDLWALHLEIPSSEPDVSYQVIFQEEEVVSNEVLMLTVLALPALDTTF